MIRLLLAPWHRLWEWAAEHRDAAVSDALDRPDRGD